MTKNKNSLANAFKIPSTFYQFIILCTIEIIINTYLIVNLLYTNHANMNVKLDTSIVFLFLNYILRQEIKRNSI